MSMMRKDSTLPDPSELMAWEEFLEITGLSQEQLEEIVSLEWLDTRTSATSAILFRDRDVYKVRKLGRICGDFELPVVGGTIIVDLLERVDRLERLVRELDNLGKN